MELKRKSVHGNGALACEDCGEVYKTKGALNDHGKKHREKKIVCEECGAKFYTPFDVKKHKRSHDPEAVIPCNLCEKLFKGNKSLREHTYIHK